MRANQIALEDEIPLEALSKVVQDAIVVTLLAGIEFLWVDFLCIIQDDPEDWRRESTKMFHVFRRSTCNIAATSSPNGTFGLFGEVDLAGSKPIEVELSQPIVMESVEVLPAGPYVLVDKSMWEREVEKAPLNCRGWVVQERFLSPRTIHFGHCQVFYECQEWEACQAFPTGIPKDLWPQNVKRDYPDYFYYGIAPWSPPSQDGDVLQMDYILTRDALRIWAEILQSYTACNITVPQDKFIAIAGLAELFHPILQSRYLAGLWEDDLLFQLLWRVELRNESVFGGASKEQTDHEEYIAPSWSWASITGRIAMDSMLYHMFDAPAVFQGCTTPVARVKDCWVELVNEYEFGCVSDGILTLQERLVAMQPLTRLALQRHQLQTTTATAYIEIMNYRDGRGNVVDGKEWREPELGLQTGQLISDWALKENLLSDEDLIDNGDVNDDEAVTAIINKFDSDWGLSERAEGDQVDNAKCLRDGNNDKSDANDD